MATQPLQINTYHHRPDRIEAVKVTKENMEDLAVWTKGWITVSGSSKVIVWHQTSGYGANSSGARVGQWLCRSKKDPHNFYTMTDSQMKHYIKE